MKKLSIGIIIGMILGIMIAVSVGRAGVQTPPRARPIPAYFTRDNDHYGRRSASGDKFRRSPAIPRCTSRSHLAEIVEHKCVPS